MGISGKAEREQTGRAHAALDSHDRQDLAVRQSVRARSPQRSVRRQDFQEFATRLSSQVPKSPRRSRSRLLVHLPRKLFAT